MIESQSLPRSAGFPQRRNETPRATLDPVSLAQIIEILAPALSHGRRREARLVTGAQRAFFTSKGCARVYVPFPLWEDESRLRTVTCGLALQASPSKEEIACLPLHDLSPVELSALSLVEGEAAMAWAQDQWPGLKGELNRLLPGIEPQNAGLEGKELVEEALRRARERRGGFQVPELFGRLPLSERARRSWGSFFRAKGRMPYTLRKTEPRYSPFAIPVGGSGGVRSRNIPPPSSGDDDPEIRPDRRIGIPYDEWNMYSGRYRRGYVSVLERHAPTDSGPTAAPPREVAQWFRLSPTRIWYKHLEDGTDLDVDAYVDQYCAAVGGQGTDGRVYRDLDKGDRDVATAILIDGTASLGTDGGLHLRLQLACADALTAALSYAREPHGVFSFSGNTRHCVEVDVLKDFGEARTVVPGQASVQTVGYTRLGAPLRHVTRRLLAVPAERRILISLGDGLPSDQGYEGHYAWGDVNQAVQEAEAAGVIIYHIGVGRVRVDPLRECFGPLRSQRVSSVRELPRILAQIHERLCEL